MENRYSGILSGESYTGIRALADFLFAFKIPNNVSSIYTGHVWYMLTVLSSAARLWSFEVRSWFSLL